MRDRGQEGNRENWGRGREEWRGDDWDREAEERNRPWGREGRYGHSGEEWNRARERGEGPWNESRWNERSGPTQEYEGSRRYEGSRDYDESREGWRRGNEGYRRGYGNYERGDYGPGAFTRQFRGGTEYYGTGQRGFGTTWGGANYTGFGSPASGYGALDPAPGNRRQRDRDPSKSGEVTLTGTVDRRDEKRMAEDVAESVSGVRDVHNQLRTQQQGAATGQSNRETATSKTK